MDTYRKNFGYIEDVVCEGHKKREKCGIQPCETMANWIRARVAYEEKARAEHTKYFPDFGASEEFADAIKGVINCQDCVQHDKDLVIRPEHEELARRFY